MSSGVAWAGVSGACRRGGRGPDRAGYASLTRVAATVLSGAAAGSRARGTAAEAARGGATKTAGWRAAALVAAAPLLVHILRLVLVRPQIVLGGDQALIELAVRDATRFDATVGVYSHFGWHHPGPAWLYLLSVPYRVGAASWSLIVAVLLLNVVWVGLIVRTASRLPRRAAEGTRASWLVALALLVLLWSLGTDTFRYVWNPNATILPAVLFLVLCCGVCLRRRGCALGAALVGTFLVQTHVGTVALVGGVGLFVLLARVALPRGRQPRRVVAPGPYAPASRSANPRRRQATAVAGTLLLVLAWVPPIVDQVAGTGNLSKVVDFFVGHHASRSWSGSVSGPGELVDRVFLQPRSGPVDPSAAPCRRRRERDDGGSPGGGDRPCRCGTWPQPGRPGMRDRRGGGDAPRGAGSARNHRRRRPLPAVLGAGDPGADRNRLGPFPGRRPGAGAPHCGRTDLGRAGRCDRPGGCCRGRRRSGHPHRAAAGRRRASAAARPCWRSGWTRSVTNPCSSRSPRSVAGRWPPASPWSSAAGAGAPTWGVPTPRCSTSPRRAGDAPAWRSWSRTSPRVRFEGRKTVTPPGSPPLGLYLRTTEG